MEQQQDTICHANMCPADLVVPADKNMAVAEVEEKERLSTAMSSYYLLYR